VGIVKKIFAKIFGALIISSTCIVSAPAIASDLTPEMAKSIAEEAFIFGYPMLQNYKTIYKRTVIQKKPFNKFTHRHKLLDPSFNLIVGPNNDTLYSAVTLDLRAEPLVVSVPNIPKERYYSIQFIDMYVHNFAYIGQRVTGSKAGNYVIARPGQYIGSIEGIDRVYQSESDFVFAIGRILVTGPDDQEDVAKLQREFKVTPLSQFLNASGTSVRAAPELNFPEYDAGQIATPKFIDLFNFLLQFVTIHRSEKHLFKDFEKIGIVPGKPSDFDLFSVDIQQAIADGIKIGYERIAAEAKDIGIQVAGWNTTSVGFGSRKVMQGKYLQRAAAAMNALYGNDREENNSFVRQVDKNRRSLDGNKANYTLRFEKGALPPSNAFWSLTMYRMPEVLLVENAISRYSIGDRTDGLIYGDDGSLTLYLQHASPEGDKAANWLPAPAGPFAIALRTYLPQQSLLSGQWQPPELIRVED